MVNYHFSSVTRIGVEEYVNDLLRVLMSRSRFTGFGELPTECVCEHFY